MDFSNFSIPYVFHVKEPIFRSITKLPCSGDLENPGQLPVLQKLGGTEVWVLWIFVISSFPTYSRSRNLFFAVSQSYHVWVNSKIQVNFRYCRNSRVLMIGSYGFSLFLRSLRFRGQGQGSDTIRYDTRYDKIRHDKMRYDTITYDTIRHDTIKYDEIRYDTIRYDTMRYDTMRYDTIE